MLDDDQARVVAHDDGPAAVLAGAGSGKTRCTTERARRRLTEAGIDGESMVLLTFTNKAAAEMRERLRALLPGGVALPWIGTFHSFGNQLLRQHGKAIGVPRNATLMDADDAGRMLDALLASPFPDKTRRQQLMRVQDEATALGLDVVEDEHVTELMALCDAHDLGKADGRRFREVLRRYEAEKRRAGVLDFSDLILLPARLLRQEPGIRERLRGRLRDVTVDEAQDTDGGQFRLLQLLAPESRTVILVGDDDQAIYEWRHARPENMRDFIDDYQATVYRLERNYRSTPAIVTGGATLVRNNTMRLEKNPYAVRGAGDHPLRLVEYDDGDAMADGVADRLSVAIMGGRKPDDIAVLYRKNRLARTLEAALLRRNIPYRIKAGTDLLSYADVRMMLAAGRLAANRRDIRALSRVADLIPGLGARGVARLTEGEGDPLARAARLAPKASQAVERLASGLDQLYRGGPGGLLDWAQKDGLFRHWLWQRAQRSLKAGRAGGAEDLEQALRPALGRMRVIQRAMDKRLGSLDAGTPLEAQWAAALEVVAAGTDEADNEDGKVTLCTVHGAKGLEWPEVHLFAFSEGLMPMERDGEVENLAEERRLAYVALTRAQDAVTLHHADRLDMGTGNGAEDRAVSRFLLELGSDDAVVRTDRRKGRPKEPSSAPARDWLAEMRKAIN
ncbi:ATP-dependent helicase [Aquisalimonas asiatica]|uniref:DNA 3'-5' helicase n=1 Tax=Aquisalimonas asiatica TaxID=406100 RepID=A0A1H8QLB2_9GAMM|nr:ATP-dependent helicase [Aquisalimonas asiatica]SEO54982.1 DNA helicase-2 / ATP-dependent DNA helicase PcrA [Aquisalimonas asiatica]